MAAQIAAAQPFFCSGNNTGLLLIHGFMGLPGEMRPLGEYLSGHGYTVSGMLVARHGQHPEKLYGVRWPEWYASVETAYNELREQCDRVFVIGFSMGGLLALHLAAQNRIDGVATLAGALQLAGGWPLRTLPVVRYVMPWFYPMQHANFDDPHIRSDLAEKMGEMNWDDPAVIAELRRSIRIPTGAIYELVKLGAAVRRELPRITAPALVLQGRRDQTVAPASAEVIYEKLGSSDKHLAWFDRSGHQLPNDVERHAVWRAIGDWISRL